MRHKADEERKHPGNLAAWVTDFLERCVQNPKSTLYAGSIDHSAPDIHDHPAHWFASLVRRSMPCAYSYQYSRPDY